MAAMVLAVILLIPNTIRSRQIVGYPAPFGDVLIPRIYHRAGTKTFQINLRSFRARRFHLIPVAATVFLFALGLQNLTVMEGRYRKPLEPVLLLNFAWVVRKREA